MAETNSPSMVRYLDKTPDEWTDIVEQWHNDKTINISLREYMGLSEVEYLRFAHNITDSNLSDEEVREEASRRGRESVVGLTLANIFGF